MYNLTAPRGKGSAMRFLSVIAATLIVVVSFNLLNAPADEPIVIPDEQAVVPPNDCDKDDCDMDKKDCDDGDCPDIVVKIPDTPTYSASVGSSGCGSCRKPLRKVLGKVAKVPAKAVKGVAKVARAPFRAVRGVVRARPVRRVLGRVFGRQR